MAKTTTAPKRTQAPQVTDTKSVSVDFSGEFYSWLDRVAEKEDRSIASLIRILASEAREARKVTIGGTP